MGILGVLGLTPRQDVEQAVTADAHAIDAVEVATRSEDIVVRAVATTDDVTVLLRGWTRRDVTLVGEQRGRTFVVDPLPDPFLPPRLPEDLHVEVLVPRGFAGSVSVRTSSGAVALDGVEAETVVATTSSGAVRATGVRARTVSATTSSGAVTAGWGPDPARSSLPDVDIRTASGAVRVGLPPDAAFGLEASTASGTLRSTFPVETTRTSMIGRVGTSGSDITLRTASGRITVDTDPVA